MAPKKGGKGGKDKGKDKGGEASAEMTEKELLEQAKLRCVQRAGARVAPHVPIGLEYSIF
jgi:hypothetical protein